MTSAVEIGGRVLGEIVAEAEEEAIQAARAAGRATGLPVAPGSDLAVKPCVSMPPSSAARWLVLDGRAVESSNGYVVIDALAASMTCMDSLVPNSAAAQAYARAFASKLQAHGVPAHALP